MQYFSMNPLKCHTTFIIMPGDFKLYSLNSWFKIFLSLVMEFTLPPIPSAISKPIKVDFVKSVLVLEYANIAVWQKAHKLYQSMFSEATKHWFMAHYSTLHFMCHIWDWFSAESPWSLVNWYFTIFKNLFDL